MSKTSLEQLQAKNQIDDIAKKTRELIAHTNSTGDFEIQFRGLLNGILSEHPTNRQRFIRALHAALSEYGQCAGDARDMAARGWAAKAASFDDTHFPYI